MLSKRLAFQHGRRFFSSIPSSIQSVGVVGSGQMGSGIGYVSAAVAGLPSIIYDVNKTQVDKAQSYIESILKKEVEKKRLTEDARAKAISLLSYSTSLDELAAAKPTIVIEAASEKLAIKESIFKDLSSILPVTTILASNTSSISLTTLAGSIPAGLDPSRVIGMHFMNPVPVMKLVEVVPALQTNQETVHLVLDLAKKMGKVTTVSKDIPGFIANRLLMPYINEAIFAVQEGIGSLEDIDTTMKLGCNMPMGPLQLADFIGLDTCLSIMEVLHSGLGDTKYRPAPLLRQYVDAGWLGKKTGRGFYVY